MRFIMNVIIARSSAHLFYLSFSKFGYRQNMFWSRNFSPNLLKITSFLLKNHKNRPALGALPPDPPALSRYKFFAAHLIIVAGFTWHKEKDGNIVSKSSAAAVTDINYYKSW